jgi:integrase
MRGTIYRRGQTWTCVYDEPSEDGRRKQRSKGGFATKREAQRFLNDQLARLDRGTYAVPSKLTLGDYLVGEWLPAVEATIRPNTFAAYERSVRLHVRPHIGGIRLQSLSSGQLTALYRQLKQEGLAVLTIRGVHTVLSRALRDAERWGRTPRNVAKLADPPALGRTRATAWTAGELRRFLDHVRGDRLFALWRLAATTGMRRGELLGLTWRTLDLEGGRLLVEQQLMPTKGGPSFGPPKSARSRRTVALDPETVEALSRHRGTQLLERDFAADAYRDGDLVFADPLGGPIRPETLSRLFTRYRKAAGVPTGTLHTLRHTAATLMLTSGVPVHIAAARLGDRAETVLSTYAHLLPQSDELAAERVAAVLTGGATLET